MEDTWSCYSCLYSYLVAGGCLDGTVRVWDINGAYCTHMFKASATVLVFDDYYLLVGCGDGKILKYCLKTKSIQEYCNHVSQVTGICIINNKMVSISRDKVLCVWNNQNAECAIPLYESLECLSCFSNELVAVGCENGTIKIVSIVQQSLVRTITVSGYPIVHLIYSESSEHLIAVTSDHIITFLDQDFKISKQIVGYNDEITDAAYFKDGLVVATNSNDFRVYLNYQPTLVSGHSDVILSIASFGELIITGSKDKTARLWNSDFKCIHIFKEHTESVTSVAIKDKYAITGSNDKTVKIWDVDGLFVLHTIVAHDRDINRVSFGSNMFATCSQDKTAKLWGMDGQLIGTMQHKRGVWCCQFSPVERILVTGSGDKSIKIWSTRDCSCLHTLEGHNAAVLNAAFISFGAQLLTCDAEGIIKLWTIASHVCVTIDAHEDRIWALIANDDGFVSGGSDSRLCFWKDTTCEEKERLFNETKLIKESQQNLDNFLLKKNYMGAFLLALQLNQKNNLYEILEQLLDANVQLDLKVLEDCELKRMLEYISDWNKRSRFCVVAQYVMAFIFKSFNWDKLKSLDSFKEFADDFAIYTEQHVARLESLLVQSYILDYSIAHQ